MALLFTFLREQLAPFTWDAPSAICVSDDRASFLGAGLFSRELARGRRLALADFSQWQEQIDLRRDAELQLRSLVDWSPGALINADAGQYLPVMTALLQAASDDARTRMVRLQVLPQPGSVILRFSDTGPGVVNPERLFHPVPQGADAAGLGLFFSGAIIRSSHGEFHHEPTVTGRTLWLRLKPFAMPGSAASWNSLERPAGLANF